MHINISKVTCEGKDYVSHMETLISHTTCKLH